MGLNLSVGILANPDLDDAEVAVFRSSFAAVNRVLTTHGIAPHVEPEDCEIWDADMGGYSSVHRLRRIAAHLDSGAALPPPGDISSAHDPVVEAYGDDPEAPRPSFLRRLLRKPPRFARGFDHLLFHSDAEGFYLPIDFADVIFAPDGADVPGCMIGSVPRLRAELDRLALALDIPDHLDPESLDLGAAQSADGPRWARYARETHACVTLRDGCRHAMSAGAALVFV